VAILVSLPALDRMIQTGEPMHAAGFRILVVLRNAQTNRNFATAAHQCRLNFDVVGLFSASYVTIGLYYRPRQQCTKFVEKVD